MAQPTNQNFLSPLGAKFEIKKLPTVNFFIQQVSLPSVQMGEVDEDAKNYIEMYNWMRAIMRVDGFDDATAWENEKNPMSDERVYSDGTLTFMNSAMNPNVQVDFKDLYPSSLSELPFVTTMNDVDYVECTATFKFTKYEITKL